MVGYVGTILIIFSISGAFAIKNKNSWFLSLPIATSIIVLIMYFFAIYHRLNVGVAAVAVLGVACAIYLLINYKGLKNLWNLEFKILMIVIVIIYICQIGATFQHMDEASHWGIVIEDMFNTGFLGSHASSRTAYKEYPPATALLEYLVLKLDGAFTQTNAYRGINLFTLSFLLPLAHMEKENKNSVWISILILLAPTVFFYTYTELLVDCTLGILFAGILYTYFSKENSRYRILTIGLMTSMVVLTKTSGISLAVIAIVIMLVDIIVEKKQKKFIAPLAAILGMAVAKISWGWHLQAENAAANFHTDGITISSILKLAAKFGEAEKAIVRKFIMDFVSADPSQGAIKLSYIAWCVVLIILGVYLYKQEVLSKKRVIALESCMILCFSVYSFYLLLMYFFVWGGALTDGSIYRYLGTCMCGMVLLLFALAIKTIKSQKVFMAVFAVTILLGRPEILKLIANPVRALVQSLH